MAFGQDKIKEFFEARTAKIATKIERTPMEKFFVFFLILITISALVLGYLQMKKNIEEPLADSYLREIRGQLREKYSTENLNIAASSQAEINKMQSADSDLDGLSDYDEIYSSHTNPYNEDTDSDGLADKEEISNGADPNCAEGQTCTTPASGAQAAGNTSVVPDLNSLPGALNLNTGSASITDLNDMIGLESQLLSGEVTLAELGIDDPELQKMLDQAKSGQIENVNEINPATKSTALDSLKNLTPAQIREELAKQGMDKALLDKVDDQTLIQLFNETLNVYQ